VSGVSGGFAILAVIIRCFPTGGRLELDDIFAIVALVFALPMGALEFVMSAQGFGKDIWNVEPENVYKIVKVSDLYCCLYTMIG
jgi:hypothetical protein